MAAPTHHHLISSSPAFDPLLRYPSSLAGARRGNPSSSFSFSDPPAPRISSAQPPMIVSPSSPSSSSAFIPWPSTRTAAAYAQQQLEMQVQLDGLAPGPSASAHVQGAPPPGVVQLPGGLEALLLRDLSGPCSASLSPNQLGLEQAWTPGPGPEWGFGLGVNMGVGFSVWPGPDSCAAARTDTMAGSLDPSILQRSLPFRPSAAPGSGSPTTGEPVGPMTAAAADWQAFSPILTEGSSVEPRSLHSLDGDDHEHDHDRHHHKDPEYRSSFSSLESDVDAERERRQADGVWRGGRKGEQDGRLPVMVDDDDDDDNDDGLGSVVSGEHDHEGRPDASIDDELMVGLEPVGRGRGGGRPSKTVAAAAGEEGGKGRTLSSSTTTTRKRRQRASEEVRRERNIQAQRQYRKRKVARLKDLEEENARLRRRLALLEAAFYGKKTVSSKASALSPLPSSLPVSPISPKKEEEKDEDEDEEEDTGGRGARGGKGGVKGRRPSAPAPARTRRAWSGRRGGGGGGGGDDDDDDGPMPSPISAAAAKHEATESWVESVMLLTPAAVASDASLLRRCR